MLHSRRIISGARQYALGHSMSLHSLAGAAGGAAVAPLLTTTVMPAMLHVLCAVIGLFGNFFILLASKECAKEELNGLERVFPSLSGAHRFAEGNE